MNTEIEILESQYRTARQNRRQAKQALDAVFPEYVKINDVHEHFTSLFSCLSKHKLSKEAVAIQHMWLNFGDELQKLSKPYEEASAAYRDAVDAEEKCRRHLDAAEQTAS